MTEHLCIINSSESSNNLLVDPLSTFEELIDYLRNMGPCYGHCSRYRHEWDLRELPLQ